MDSHRWEMMKGHSGATATVRRAVTPLGKKRAPKGDKHKDLRGWQKLLYTCFDHKAVALSVKLVIVF